MSIILNFYYTYVFYYLNFMQKPKNKVYAKQSFSKDPYECKQDWPADIFCQCGGDGVVFTDKKFSIEKALSDTNEALEVIGTVAGVENKKEHYRTAFFEAFPKNPSCFLRGEGVSVEEAELNAWNKYQKILNCQNHDFSRKDKSGYERTDGYAFCTKCPLSGTFLEPTTTCCKCGVPTCFKQNIKKEYLCMDHFFSSEDLDEVFEDISKTNSFLDDYTIENQKMWFLEEQILYTHYKQKYQVVDKKKWEAITHAFSFYRSHIEGQFNPFFGKATKTELEIHKMIVEAIPVLYSKIDDYLKAQKII